ncbi:hypothetical protein [Leucobacter sp. cx-169]|uniref:hypothetical protein n=1 Tax=Leucobacter sp. cx-169 TaxID=2770549 RepID=UPI00165E25A8|nr:hypothetical protein [Leucobacter sp. cx-169]MBC9927296.1 hypothetical protein [Leucobacter sp. cx-169]
MKPKQITALNLVRQIELRVGYVEREGLQLEGYERVLNGLQDPRTSIQVAQRLADEWTKGCKKVWLNHFPKMIVLIPRRYVIVENEADDRAESATLKRLERGLRRGTSKRTPTDHDEGNHDRTK